MASKKPKSPHPNAVHLTVTSVRRSLQFYTEKLGFKLAQCHPDAHKPVWASVVLGSQSLMLGELPSLAEARQFGMGADEIEVLKQDARAFARGTPGIGVSYFLETPNVDTLAKKLRKQRVKLLCGPTTQFYGLRELQLADPDGYRLVFYSHATAAGSAKDA